MSTKAIKTNLRRNLRLPIGERQSTTSRQAARAYGRNVARFLAFTREAREKAAAQARLWDSIGTDAVRAERENSPEMYGANFAKYGGTYRAGQEKPDTSLVDNAPIIAAGEAMAKRDAEA